MEALITEIIPKQGFELVEDRILLILLLNLQKQRELQPEIPEFVAFMERRTPIDKHENVMINVLFDNANYSGFTEGTAEGTTIYYIDVYANGVSSNDEPGYLNSGLKVQRFLGMIRYILQSTKYSTLDFPRGFIGGTSLRNIQVFDPSNNQDGMYMSQARMSFGVRINEEQEFWKGADLAGADTELKLELTENGYKYTLNNI